MGSGINFEEIKEFGALHGVGLGVLPRESLRAAQVRSLGQCEPADKTSQTPLNSGGATVVDTAANSLVSGWKQPEACWTCCSSCAGEGENVSCPCKAFLSMLPGPGSLAEPSGGSERGQGALSGSPAHG